MDKIVSERVDAFSRSLGSDRTTKGQVRPNVVLTRPGPSRPHGR